MSNTAHEVIKALGKLEAYRNSIESEMRAANKLTSEIIRWLDHGKKHLADVNTISETITGILDDWITVERDLHELLEQQADPSDWWKQS